MDSQRLIIRPIQLDTDMSKVISIWFKASIKAHVFIDAEYWADAQHDMQTLYIPNSETWVSVSVSIVGL